MSKALKIKKLLEVLKASENGRDITELTIRQMMKNMEDEELPKTVQDEITKFFERLKKTIHKEATAFFAKYVDERLMEAEIDELIGIYSNPIFLKLNTKEIMEQSFALGKKLAEDEFAKIEPTLDQLMNEAEKTK